MNARWQAAATTALVMASVLVAAPLASADTGGTVFVQTVPALAGVDLAVGSSAVTTGSDGSAAVRVADLNGVAHSVTLNSTSLGDGTLLSIRKVVSAPHSAAHQSHLTVGLDVTASVHLTIDAGTTGVSATSVRSVRLRSINGETVVVDPRTNPTVSLLARRPRLVGGQLQVQAITWSVDRINAGPGVALTTATPRFDAYQQSAWRLVLQPMHGTVQITTVPATPNVTFLLEGASVTTGADGTASAPVTNLNDVASRLQLDSHDAGDSSVSLVQVSPLKSPAPHQRKVLAALTVRRPVTLHFVDHHGQAVDPSRIDNVVLEGDGTKLRLDSTQLTDPVMLTASTATQVDGVWRSRPSTYSVSSVRIEGGEAVFAGRQRIAPSTSRTWTIALSVFSLTVRVHDVLFGTSVSTRVVVTRPDGSTFPFHAPKAVPSMVRGLYTVKVNAAVLGATTSVLVSRDDVVDLRVITALDAALIAATALLVLAAIVLGGVMLAKRRGHPASRTIV